MTKEKLTEIMYLFRDMWCQNIDLSTIDEFIDDLAEREVKLFAIPDVSTRRELLFAFLKANENQTIPDYDSNKHLMIDAFLGKQ